MTIAFAQRRFTDWGGPLPPDPLMGDGVAVVQPIGEVMPPPLGKKWLEFNDPNVVTTLPDGRQHRGFKPDQLEAIATYYENQQQNTVLPPDEWRIQGKPGRAYVDPEWRFFTEAKSEKPTFIYVYSVKEFPDLLKIGIAKNRTKRKEAYYKRCLFKREMPSRVATLVEYLFKHATYHRAHLCPPRWNVGNFQKDNALPELLEFFDAYQDAPGSTEVRLMTLNEAKTTIDKIWDDVKWRLCVDELALKYGIQTFAETPADLNNSRGAHGGYHLPHEMWIPGNEKTPSICPRTHEWAQYL